MAEQPALGFGALLRQLRAEARLTQEELAEAAGLSPRSVSDLERGVNRTARKDTAEVLAQALGLAGTVRISFVAAARGRAAPADVLAARRGEVPAPAGSVWAGCPYLGLMPFREQDAKVFYGRGDLVAQLVRWLVERLGQGGLLLVAGESGAGKSSLLRAGLMPRLAEGALGPGSARWPRRVIRPAGRPLRELANELADVASTDPESVYRSLAAVPDAAPVLVDLAVRTAVGREAAAAPREPAAAPRLILAVDQFEELFTAAADTGASRAEPEAFIAALHAAATVPAGPHRLPSALVIAAVRADFLGRLIAYPALKAALDGGPFTVGPMSEAELRLAMTGPAAEGGLVVESAVVEAVIGELREGAWGGLGTGVLPLMSQAMAATWESREGAELTLRAYRRTGGVADAVNRSAQAAYNSLTSAQQDAARLVFTQLTTITLDGKFERRRCARTDLRPPGVPVADIDTVIDVFSAQRLLLLGQDSVEISHDILLQTWKQLRDWLGDDQLDRARYSQVMADAHTWDSNGRDPSYLYQPGRLATIDAAVTRWASAPARYPPLPATSSAFLSAAHHAARQSSRRRRGAVAALAALAVFAIGAAAIAVANAASASGQHAIALSRQLAADSLAIDPGDPLTARRLAVAAWRVSPTDQARSAMTTLLIEQQQGGYAVGDSSNPDIAGVAFSPDSRLLAIAEADGYVRLWNLATGQPAGLPIPVDTGSAGGVLEVVFSSDGKLLASLGADGYVRLWNPATGQAVGTPLPAGTSPAGNLNALAFSPDSKLLATIDGDGYVRLWNLATRQGVPPMLPTGLGTAVLGLAFSPDGKLLATAGADGYARLWNPATGQAVGTPFPADTGSISAVDSVAFSPDSKLLATADGDGNVQLWNLATGQPVGTPLPAGAGSGVNEVTFSPDGKLLATADANGAIGLWDPATGQAVGTLVQAESGTGVAVPRASTSSVLNWVAFSPDGKLLATTDNGTAQTWQTSMFADPYAVLCAEVGPPTKAEWTLYAPGESQPSICS